MTREEFTVKWFSYANAWMNKYGFDTDCEPIGAKNAEEALEIFRHDLDAVIKDADTTEG